jgi:hypothetical protein
LVIIVVGQLNAKTWPKQKVITQLSLPMTFKDEEWVDGSLPIPT